MAASLDPTSLLPAPVRHWVARWADSLSPIVASDNPRVMARLLPSALRGLVLQRGKQPRPVRFAASHDAWFDFSYSADQPELATLYSRAKDGQWNGATDLDWRTSVDPMDRDVPILPDGFVDLQFLRDAGVRLNPAEEATLLRDIVSWLLSQFLHGEQGALMAACQVTEAVESFDGKMYGATQVMDEARHVEVFNRYLTTKLGKLYPINDNLFVVLDALMTDSRWDMKFLGMQIMVEGLALGAFGTLHGMTREPLVKELLHRVILDEARHVHYGVVALRDHFNQEISPTDLREREDWAFEMAILMRNRFLAREVWEEWFSPATLSWADWKRFVYASPGMEAFRRTMFSRMVPNLREIGLLSERIRPHYAREGLGAYFNGAAAPEVKPEELLSAA